MTGRVAIYEQIYATDLVYQADCWQLCGDPHCCSFARHKTRFPLLGRLRPGQELPLLPGEYDFLQVNGWTAQFGEHDRRTVDYDFGPACVRLDTIVSRRPNCACDHGTRTTICRLYPLLPGAPAHRRRQRVRAVGARAAVRGADRSFAAKRELAAAFDSLRSASDFQRAGELGGNPVAAR